MSLYNRGAERVVEMKYYSRYFLCNSILIAILAFVIETAL